MSGVPLDRLAKSIKARPIGCLPPTASGVAADSREIKPGQLFWCLPGTHTDGHLFLDDARRRGAVAAAVSHVPRDASLPLLLVKDTREALWEAARWYRQTLATTVVAITGSAGKTTTKEAVAAVLRPAFRVAASPGNRNNQIGLPLTVLNVDRNDEVAVLEHGTSEPGEIVELAAVSRPDMAIITRVGPAHLERLRSIRTVFYEKTSLLGALSASGIAWVNGDDEVLAQSDLHRHPRVRWFGFGATARALGAPPAQWASAEDGIEVRLGRSSYRVRARGRPMAYAALVAILVAKELGLRDELIRQGLATVRPAPHRCVVMDLTNCVLLDDCYNANPISVRACVDLLDELAQERGWRRVLVLADMLELGTRAQEIHAQLGKQIADRLDELHTIGSMARSLGEAAGAMNPRLIWNHADTVEALLEKLLHAGPGAVIAVKGSRAWRMERIVEALQAAFGSVRQAA